jgi:hypothetical protein
MLIKILCSLCGRKYEVNENDADNILEAICPACEGDLEEYEGEEI